MLEEIQVVYADNKKVRARVRLLPPNTYYVDIERLYDATDAGGVKRGEYWAAIEGLTSLTDNEERAKELAQENLRCGTAE